jgi:hypothetical protein
MYYTKEKLLFLTYQFSTDFLFFSWLK